MRKFAFFALVLFFDFLTKHWVVTHLPLIRPLAGFPFGGIGVLDTSWLKISIVHTTNTGTAWGLFSNFQGLLLVVRLLIVGGLLGYLLFLKPPQFLRMPLALILGGALGNILSVFVYGHVVDMIYLIFFQYSYPIFNVADSMIFCSVAYLFFYTTRKKNRQHAESSR